MSRLRDELGVAPRPGIAISVLLAFVGTGAWLLVADRAPLAARIPLALALALLVFLYGFLVSYVYGAARRRGMRPAPWALAAAFVPNALGFIAYFLLREPLLQRCGACGASARRAYAFCTQCGAPLGRTCPTCRRPVEAFWDHCAHCGTKLEETTAQDRSL